MRVSTGVEYREWSTRHTGKGKFILRLIPALKDLGIEIVRPGERAEIDLQLGKYIWEPNADKSIIRMGCPHFNDPSPNKRKTAAIRMADGVVYQSAFARKHCDKLLCKAEKSVVINNGAPPNVGYHAYNETPIFIAATRIWNRVKNLDTIVKGFKKAGIGTLWVVGRTEKRVKVPNVKYFGLVSDDQLMRLYRAADVMIHLCTRDACPNSVVEAMVSGCRVITNEDAGTKELLTDKDIIIHKDSELSSAIERIKPERMYPEKLDIKNVALRYVDFFNEVLG